MEASTPQPPLSGGAAPIPYRSATSDHEITSVKQYDLGDHEEVGPASVIRPALDTLAIHHRLLRSPFYLTLLIVKKESLTSDAMVWPSLSFSTTLTMQYGLACANLGTFQL